MTNWVNRPRIGMIVIGALVIVIVVLLALLLNPEDESERSDEPGAISPLAAGSPVSGQANGFVPDTCWSEGDRLAQDAGAENVFQFPQWANPPEMVIDEGETYRAVLSTNKGDMIFELNTDAAPVTVNNFICLAANDYYDVTPFHRVVSGFMVQGGDPTGTGTGGPGYQFDDELPSDELEYTRGTLAMANSGPNTQGGQVFIVHQDLNGRLENVYTIFGQMVEGEEVLDDVADSAVVPGPNGELSRPVEFLVIEDVTIETAS